MQEKKPLSEKQLAALAKGREARLTKREATEKQKVFADVFVKTLNPSEAVRQAYAVEDSSAATIANIGQENLNKPIVQELIRGLKQQMVEDSSFLYSTQKQIMTSAINQNNLELANKIVNKTLDRAGFMPVSEQINRSITAKFLIKRG